MPVLVVQHLEPEQPSLLGAALIDEGCEIDLVRVDLGQPLPSTIGGHDALVVLGGPMSAASDEGFPSRRDEIALLADALDRGTPTLGVCLGAQLLAVAAGAGISAGPEAEIGWGPIRLHDAATSDPLFAGVGPDVEVLHWHGETFDLPAGSVLLAGSDRYAHQAVRVGDAAWGLQFHLEVDDAAVRRFVAAFPEDAATVDGGAETILAGSAAALERLAPARRAVLSRFAALARPT